MKPAITIVAIILAIIGIVIGLIAYSYTQIQVSLDNVSFAGLDWAPASLATILKLGINVLTDNILGAALTLITGIKLNLIFALSNHGIFPVYIPDLSYNLSINGVNIGQGQSTVDTTINPGETKQLPVLQDFQINSLKSAAATIIGAGGMINLQVSGTAYFKFLWFTVPVPFHSIKQISIMDEIRNHFGSAGSQNQQSSNNSYQPVSPPSQPTITQPPTNQNPSNSVTIANSAYKVSAGTFYPINFNLPCSATVTGSFSAQAALGNNIIVYIFDQSNFNNYQAGSNYMTLYNSGKVTSDTFNVAMSSGTYYIVLSNTYSSFSTKTVGIEASYTCS